MQLYDSTFSSTKVSLQLAAVTPSDEESSSSGSTSVGSGSKVDVRSEDEMEDEDESTVVAPATSDLCGQAPCDWFGEGIWDECNNLKEQGCDNKVAHFHAYKIYTRLRHGVLCHFDHRPLPVCVHGEIMDSWPDPNHEYVGFQQAMIDAAKGDD